MPVHSLEWHINFTAKANEEMLRTHIIKEFITKEQDANRLQVLKTNLLIELTRMEKICTNAINIGKSKLRALDDTDRYVKQEEYTSCQRSIDEFSTLLQTVKDMFPLTKIKTESSKEDTES